MHDNILKSQTYGGIEIKQNAQKNTFIGFIYSVALHALLILLYVGWTWITSENKSKIIHPGIFHFIDIASPPTTVHDIASPPPILPKLNIARPSVGIPIPVPEIQAPVKTFRETDISLPGNPNARPGTDIGTRESTNSAIPPPVKVIAPEKPDRSVFVAVDEDPKPIQNIQLLIQYPDQAKRSGVEGKVSYSALIGIDGRVKEVLIDKSDYDVFKQPVIDALMKTRFTPARVDQNPVEVYYSGTIDFKLNGR